MARLKTRLGPTGYFDTAGETAARTGLKVPETGFFGREFDVQDFRRMGLGLQTAYNVGEDLYKGIAKPVYEYFTQPDSPTEEGITGALSKLGQQPSGSPAAQAMSKAAKNMIPAATAPPQPAAKPGAMASPVAAAAPSAAAKPSMSDADRQKLLAQSEFFAELDKPIGGSVEEMAAGVIEGVSAGPGTAAQSVERQEAVSRAMPLIKQYNAVTSQIRDTEKSLDRALSAGDIGTANQLTEVLEGLTQQERQLFKEKEKAMNIATALKKEEGSDVGRQIQLRKQAAQAMQGVAPMGAPRATAQIGAPAQRLGPVSPTGTPVSPLQARVSAAPAMQAAAPVAARRQAPAAAPPPSQPQAARPAAPAPAPSTEGMILGRVTQQEYATIRNALRTSYPDATDQQIDSLAMKVALEQKAEAQGPKMPRYQQLLDRPDLLSDTRLTMQDLRMLAENARADQWPTLRGLVIKHVEESTGPLNIPDYDKPLKEIAGLIPSMKARSGIKFGMQELADIRGRQASTRGAEALAEQRELKNLRRKARKPFGRDRRFLKFLIPRTVNDQVRWSVDMSIIDDLSGDSIQDLKIPGVKTKNELIDAAQRAADRSNRSPARMRIIEGFQKREAAEKRADIKAGVKFGKKFRDEINKSAKLNRELEKLKSNKATAQKSLEEGMKVPKGKKGTAFTATQIVSAKAKVENIQARITAKERELGESNLRVEEMRNQASVEMPTQGTQPSATRSYYIISTTDP